MQLLPGLSLSNILMASHLLISLKTIHTHGFFRPKPKSIFGVHDPSGLQYLFQLRVSKSFAKSQMVP